MRACVRACVRVPQRASALARDHHGRLLWLGHRAAAHVGPQDHHGRRQHTDQQGPPEGGLKRPGEGCARSVRRGHALHHPGLCDPRRSVSAEQAACARPY
eukprot:6173168-Pleurochrysis_carterae.AAC.4